MIEPVKITEVVSDCFKSPSELPAEKLAQNLRATREYFFDSVEHDCRGAKGFIDEWLGKGLYKHFNDSWEDFCLEHIGRSAQWINHIAEGLELMDTSRPIPTKKAIAVTLKNSTVPDRTRKPLPETLDKAAKARELREQGLSHRAIAQKLECSPGYVPKRMAITNTSYNITSVSDRPKTRGTSSEYRQALLERDASELAEEVKAGKLTTNQAMVKAGKVKSRTFTFGPRTDIDALAQKLLTHDRQMAMALAEAITDHTP